MNKHKKYNVKIRGKVRPMTAAQYVKHLRAMAQRDKKDPLLDDYHVQMSLDLAASIERGEKEPRESE